MALSAAQETNKQPFPGYKLFFKFLSICWKRLLDSLRGKGPGGAIIIYLVAADLGADFQF